MKWMRNLSLGGTFNLLLFSTLTVAGAYLFKLSLAQKDFGSEEEIGRVTEKSGTVTVKNGRNHGWVPATAMTPVYDKTSLYTEAASRASVQVRDTLIQVDEKTLIQVIDPQRRTELNMDFGGLRLTSKKKEQLILNVGGERVKLSLEGATVKIKREKKSRTLKIESVSGSVKVESAAHKEIVVPQGEALNFDVHQDSASSEPPPQAPPPPPLQLKFQSEYAHDEKFSRRPALKLSVLSEIRDAQYETSADGLTWSRLSGDTFLPEREGEYQVRVRGRYADGEEVTSEPRPWTTEVEHFQLRQPRLRRAKFRIDPTVPTARQEELPAIGTVEYKFESGRTVNAEIAQVLKAAEIPAGAVAVRAVKSNLPFQFDRDWSELLLEVRPPKPEVKQGTIVLRPVILEQYYYQATRKGESEPLLLSADNRIQPACASDCEIEVRFRSKMNPDWTSSGATVRLKGRTASVRALAAVESPKALTTETVKPELLKFSAREPWIFEIGLGGNYINMSTNSPLTSASTGGFSGPGVFASGERQGTDWNVKASYLGIFTKMKSVSNTGTTTQTLAWQSLWAGASNRGAWILDRFEYGVTYQQMPLFFQDASGGGRFQNANTVAATVGFNTYFPLGERGRLVWDQRFLLPVSSRGEGSIASFSPRYGVEGDLSYYHCLANQWAVGAAWLGQYMNANFSLRQEPGVLAESSSTTMFNSNFQIRLQHGVCQRTAAP